MTIRQRKLRWRAPWEAGWGGEGFAPESADMVHHWLGDDHPALLAWETDRTVARAWAVVIAARGLRAAAREQHHA